MTTPGSNTLAQAMSVQGKQLVNYYSVASRSVGPSGKFVSSFLPPVPILANVQPLQRSLYDQLGLDLQKNYSTIYMPNFVITDIERGTSGDNFSYQGRMWQVESKLDWKTADNWISSLCSDIGPDPNLYLSLSQFINPGQTEDSSYTFEDVAFGKRLVIVDIPVWTIEDLAFHELQIGSGLPSDTAVVVDVSISGQYQGQYTAIVDSDEVNPEGVATDYPVRFPGLATFGVVAGGLRVQHNVRLTISAPTVTTGGIVLSRGVGL